MHDAVIHFHFMRANGFQGSCRSTHAAPSKTSHRKQALPKQGLFALACFEAARQALPGGQTKTRLVLADLKTRLVGRLVFGSQNNACFENKAC